MPAHADWRMLDDSIDVLRFTPSVARCTAATQDGCEAAEELSVASAETPAPDGTNLAMRGSSPNLPATTPGPSGRAGLAGLEFDRLAETEVVRQIIDASQAGRGGWVATPNIDICRQTRRDPAARALVRGATMVVPDGMPLLWAARLRDDRLVERVTGSSLIFSLTSAAACGGRSIYLLGGEPGVPELAGAELARRYPGLKVVGAAAPPVGFDQTTGGVLAVRDSLLLAAPDIVYVGLGFPKQERLIAQLIPALPTTWFIACGAAIPFAAGALSRAPLWMQRSGLEWMFRLLSEPRRLFRRYLVDDLPYAASLLASCAVQRIRARLPGKGPAETERRQPFIDGVHQTALQGQSSRPRLSVSPQDPSPGIDARAAGKQELAEEGQ
jgi:N-acetylglucosaminyldiphosphoundecaprenol N-acetyl-beta-D-mannosaminyltransferase